MKTFEGKLVSEKPIKIGIVCARFNEFIVSKLLGGALDALSRHNIKDDDISVAWVPGAFELGFAAKKLVDSGKYDGIMTLGAVIKGETDHYAMIINNVTSAVMELNLAGKVPVTFGMLTTENIDQALQRSGLKVGNEGSATAQSLLEMMSLQEKIG